EITTIERWVDAGAPRGNPSDMPAPIKFDSTDIWHIGKPDLVVKTKPHVVPATGSDWWGDEVADSGLTEDRYLKAGETKTSPEGLAVVHHAVTYLIQDESDSQLIGRQDEGGLETQGGFLNEYAVGKNGDIFPDGTGRLVKAGAKIRFNFHLHSMGEERREQT